MAMGQSGDIDVYQLEKAHRQRPRYRYKIVSVSVSSFWTVAVALYDDDEQCCSWCAGAVPCAPAQRGESSCQG